MCSRHEHLSHVIGIRPQWATTSVREKATMASFSKEDKFWIKSLCEQKRYNAGQFVTKFLSKCWTKRALLLSWENMLKSTVAAPMKMLTLLNRWPVLRQDNMNEHVKLDMGIISGSVLMLWTKVESILFTPLEDTHHQSRRVYWDTVYIFLSGNHEPLFSVCSNMPLKSTSLIFQLVLRTAV